MEFVKHLVYSNILVSVANSALLYLTMSLFCLPVDIKLIIFGFASTFCVYNFHRLAKLKTYHQFIHYSEQLIFFRAYQKTILLTASIAFLLTIYLAYALFPITHLIALTILTIIVLMYMPTNILPTSLQIRQIPLLKNIAVASIWSILTIILPLVYYQKELNNFVWLFFLHQTFLFTSITLILDQRDILIDKTTNVKTLATTLSKPQNYFLINLLLISSLLVNFFLADRNLFLSNLLILLMLLFRTILLKKASHLLISLIFDALLILQVFTYLLFKY